MSARFRLQLDRERYTPGDTVRGQILVLEGGETRSLDVMLQYNEEAEDDYSAVATSISSGPLRAGELATGRSFDSS